MSASFQAKDSQVRDRQLLVQSIVIPFSIVGNATSTAVLPTNDEPSILFMNTQGVNQITAALSPGEAVPTYVSPSDGLGKFSILVKINEQLVKVVDAFMVQRAGAAGNEVVACRLANTTGLSADGDKICLDADSAIAINASNTLDYALHVAYVTHE